MCGVILFYLLQGVRAAADFGSSGSAVPGSDVVADGSAFVALVEAKKKCADVMDEALKSGLHEGEKGLAAFVGTPIQGLEFYGEENSPTTFNPLLDTYRRGLSLNMLPMYEFLKKILSSFYLTCLTASSVYSP